jgi:glycerate 2-kinase
MILTCRNTLLEVGRFAIQSVRGDRLVEQALGRTPIDTAVDVVAIGKAAAAMGAGACRALGERLQRALVITKTGHALPELAHYPGVETLEAGHPVPTTASLLAGARLLEWLRAAPADRRMLFLISGGASSLVEAPAAGIDLDDLVRINTWLLASGLGIDQINAIRRRVSLIKGGNLLRVTGRRQLEAWLLSDVAGDNPGVIGSGLLYPGPAPQAVPVAVPHWLTRILERLPEAGPVAETAPPHRVLANLQTACEAAARRVRRAGLVAHVHRVELDGDAAATGTELARRLLGELPAGIHIWGGETTVRLPDRPGRGGRNQHLALAAAGVLAGQTGVCLLAIGTDGSDGPTEDAGALVDGGTLLRGELSGLDASEQLRRADSGAFLEASGDLISTGPTGTNVRDLVIAWKGQ